MDWICTDREQLKRAVERCGWADTFVLPGGVRVTMRSGVFLAPPEPAPEQPPPPVTPAVVADPVIVERDEPVTTTAAPVPVTSTPTRPVTRSARRRT